MTGGAQVPLAQPLPDLTHSFSFNITGKQEYALGVRGRQLGLSFAPVAHLLRKLDLTTQGWAPAYVLQLLLNFCFGDFVSLTFIVSFPCIFTNITRLPGRLVGGKYE